MNADTLQDDRIRRLLDDRSAVLARRGRAVSQAARTEAYLVCACGSERLGLPVSGIASIVAGKPCTPVPGAPPGLRGIVAIAGGIVSVIDLGEALGLARGDHTPETGHILRLRAQEPPVGLAVDRVLGIAHIEPSAVTDAAALAGDASLGGDCVLGYAPPDPSPARGIADGFSILDPRRVLQRYLS